jgi:hypothetical protein
MLGIVLFVEMVRDITTLGLLIMLELVIQQAHYSLLTGLVTVVEETNL